MKQRSAIGAILVHALNCPPQQGVQQPSIAADLRCIDPKDLWYAAAWHRITPAIYLLLKDGSTDEHERLIPALRAGYQQQLARHLQTLADLKVVGKALNDAQIRWCVVKGPALTTIWPRPDMREYGDLDILVDRHRLADTLDVLVASKVRLVDRNWPLIRQQMRGELTLQLPYGTKLDLHWDLVNEASLRTIFTFPNEQMLARTRTVNIGGVPVPTLDPADTLLHLGYHTSLSGAYRLMWLKDLEAATANGLDWDLAARRAKLSGVGLPLAISLDRALRVLTFTSTPPSRTSDFPVWRGLTRLADRVRPVPWTPGESGSARILYQNARATSVRSIPPVIRDAVRRKPEQRDESWTNPLHDDRPDADARESYISLVEGGLKP